MESVKRRKLVLSTGSEYCGEGFGSDMERVCEVVFNTSMAGYQEIVSDPSYTDQAVCMTYPIIGNYGITDEDYETKTPTIGALLVRDYNDNPSNFRYTKAIENQRRFSGRQLGAILERLAEADAAMKSAGADDRAALETAVVEIFEILQREALT